MPTIIGRDNFDEDLQLIQAKLQTGADRLELEGTFDFGLEGERKTLVIDRPLTIVAGPAGATIRGGGMSLGAQGDAGVFVVMNAGAGPVVIKGLRFEQSRLASIVVNQCRGLEVRACEFVDGQLGSSALLVNASGTPVTSVSAVVAYGAGCAGRFVAASNRCAFGGPAAGAVPDDEQFIATFGTRFDSITITENQIATRDDGIEVLRNGYDAPAMPACELAIRSNQITIDQRVGVPVDEVWPVHAGIVCCLNGAQGAGATHIAGNTIVASGPNVSAFILSGENITVTNNNVTLQTGAGAYPTAAFLFGFDVQPSAGIGHMGASLKHSEIVDNTIVGSAPHAIWAWDDLATPEVNDSRDNEVKNNNFRAFTSAGGASVYPEALRAANTFAGNNGL